MSQILVALALVLVIEGVAYALFPGPLKRMMIAVLKAPEGTLRVAGLAAVVLGVALVWLVRQGVNS